MTVQTELVFRYLKLEDAVVLRVDTNLQKLRIPIVGKPVRVAVQPWVIMVRLLRQLPRCELLHIEAATRWGFLPAVIGVPLARLFKKRCVLSFHSGAGPIFMDRCPWLVKTVFRLSTVATVCSVELQEAFRERGIETVFVHNLFDADLIRYRRRDTLKPKLVWTRSFEELYDPWAAIRVFEAVVAKYPDASMVMTSNGPLLEEIRRYAEERGLSGIRLVGRVPAEQVAQFMYEADICLNTSKFDGVPTALLEAGACGLPIVSTDAGGIASVFKDGERAMLSPVGDADGLARSVLHLLENPAIAMDMGLAAREVALRYTWPNASRELVCCYGFSEDVAGAGIGSDAAEAR